MEKNKKIKPNTKTKKKKEFVWTDKLVLEFTKVSVGGSYGIYDNAKSINDKLKIFKMDKQGLLNNDNTEVRLKSSTKYGNSITVKLSDIVKHGNILSAEYHINRLNGKDPYILKDGVYVRALSSKIKDAEYLTPQQAQEINNLSNAKKHIDIEIENIKKKK